MSEDLSDMVDKHLELMSIKNPEGVPLSFEANLDLLIDKYEKRKESFSIGEFSFREQIDIFIRDLKKLRSLYKNEKHYAEMKKNLGIGL